MFVLWLGICVEVVVDRIWRISIYSPSPIHSLPFFIGQLVEATPNHKLEAASSVQQKDKMADGTPRRLCVSYSSSMGSISAERGRVISGHLSNRFGSRFGKNTKLLRGVIKPISTPNN